MNRIAHKILRKPFFGRFETPWHWPKDISQDGWDRVEFKNAKGVKLVGYWKNAVAPIGTLVLAHPMGKAAKGFWLRYGHAELFLKNNFNVFLFDANGFGESEAASFDYPADFLAAGIYAKNKVPNLDVGLVGASFGGAWGLCSMAREGSPYTTAILEAVFPTLPDFWKHYPIAHTAIQASKIIWPSIERDLRPIEEASRLLGQPNIMLIYGDSDIYTPPSHGEKLSHAMRNAANVEMHVISGGKHTYIYRDQPDEYIKYVLPFLKKSFTKPSE